MITDPNTTIDPLTGLVFGSGLYAEMEKLLAQAKEFSLLVMDIDNLSTLNRAFGLDAGDAVFRRLGQLIQTRFPKPAFAIREKGDQFYVLLPSAAKEKAFLQAEDFRKKFCEVETIQTTDGKPLGQSISIGVSSYPEDGANPGDIFRKADSALLRAKKNGRNQVNLAREEKLMPKTSHYTQAQLEKLSRLADKINMNESALLRDALDDLLQKHGDLSISQTT